jgi:hypothetical protein
MDSTLPTLLKSSAARSIGSEVIAKVASLLARLSFFFEQIKRPSCLGLLKELVFTPLVSLAAYNV